MSTQLERDAASEATIYGLLYRQLFRHRKPLPAGLRITGHTAIVTGANVGLGLEACRQLLQLDLAYLIMAVRSRFKGDQAASALRSEFPKAQIDVWMLDMEDYDSITAFADQCKALPRIDFVMLNAGLQNSTFRLTPATRHAQTLQVNYISTALLAILLLPVLKAARPHTSAKPPVLCLSTSDMASMANLSLDQSLFSQFDKDIGYSWSKWYSREKLLQHFLVAKLAELISAEDVIINMVSPGATSGTAFFRDAKTGFFNRVIDFMASSVARSISTGASTYIDALVVKGKESHGSYIGDWDIRPYPPVMYTKIGDELKERCWEETMSELNFAHASKALSLVAFGGIDKSACAGKLGLRTIGFIVTYRSSKGFVESKTLLNIQDVRARLAH